MKIDPDGNIEIESEEDSAQKRVNDYGFTSDPDQIIYTRGLVHCVGLGLIKQVGDIRKRGLMHVFYNKEFTRNPDGSVVVRQDRLEKTEKCLEDFAKDFEKDEHCRVVFTDPKAILVYNRTLVVGQTTEKIYLRDDITGELNQREVEDLGRYENPMARYIEAWLKKMNINLYLSNARTNKQFPSVLNMEYDPKETHHKDFALTHSKVKIGMYNKAGSLLNKNDYAAGLEF